MHRRKFLSLLGGAGVASTVGATTAKAASTASFDGYPDAMGVLHDSTRCIGCRKCEQGCNTVNNFPKPEKPFSDLSVLDTKRRTNATTHTVVNKYNVAGLEHPIFRKQQCNHCMEPACASACFVKAFSKNPNGSVTYNGDVCVGCRYCMIACPFSVPTFEYDDAFDPLIQKCTMCHPLLEKGELPGCVQACPKEALTFGRREDLLEIARERIRKHPKRYGKKIYGEVEAGGTNWLYLAPVKHTDLGQPVVSKKSAPELTAGALGAVPMVVGIWPVLLTGAYAISKRKEKIAADDQKAAVAQAVSETQAAAENKLKAAMEKAAKDKKAAIARETKKAVANAEKAFEEKLAALQNPESEDVEETSTPEGEA